MPAIKINKEVKTFEQFGVGYARFGDADVGTMLVLQLGDIEIFFRKDEAVYLRDRIVNTLPELGAGEKPRIILPKA
jgi:hypothetical protein